MTGVLLHDDCLCRTPKETYPETCIEADLLVDFVARSSSRAVLISRLNASTFGTSLPGVKLDVSPVALVLEFIAYTAEFGDGLLSE